MPVRIMTRFGSMLFAGLLLSALLCGCVHETAEPEPSRDEQYRSIGNSTVYYTDNINQSDVDLLIDYFDTDQYFNGKRQLMLDKPTSDRYEIYVSVNDYVFESETQLLFYQHIADSIALNVVYPNKVTVYLCDDDLEPKSTIQSNIP